MRHDANRSKPDASPLFSWDVRASAAAVVLALLAGCSSPTTDLREHVACDWREAVPHPVYGHHDQTLSCKAAVGPAKAVFAIPACPYEHQFLLSHDHSLGWIHVLIESGGATVLDRNFGRAIPVEDRDFFLSIPAGNATQVELTLRKDSQGNQFRGDLSVTLRCP